MRQPTIRPIDRTEWQPWCYVDEEGKAWPTEYFGASTIEERDIHIAVRESRFLIARAKAD